MNGPRSTVVAGDSDTIERFERVLARAGLMRWRVPGVNFVGHSAAVDVIETALIDALSTLTPEPSRVPVYSTVTGGPHDTTRMDAGYWYRNLRDPVRFHTA
ncbi:acyltransferase domain-containing protein, partial [Saccharothrix sp. NRRL B-16314]|uniref:acyltransferase domain-containing protein n=1 Tax=Saccharothrix sp. NRRL B-16314 TaxID=1463825 RepID=UPI001E4C0F32